MAGGTEAFPSLGKHCQNPDCKQLDFLPFTCDACKLLFCLEHRSYKSHDCPKSDHGSRTVIVCESCSTAIETTGYVQEGLKSLLEKHAKSGDCDPKKKKKKKKTCPVKRCREVSTFMNNVTCKDCGIRVCLKHRFPADHGCKKTASTAAMSISIGGRWNDKFLGVLNSRNGKDCGRGKITKAPPGNPSVRSF